MRPEYTYAATVVRVIDGDTLYANVDLGFRMTIQITVRLLGINTPELNTDAGKMVRDYMRTLLEGQKIVLKTHKDPKDKYGRWLGEIYANDVFINELLVEKNYAVRTK